MLDVVAELEASPQGLKITEMDQGKSEIAATGKGSLERSPKMHNLTFQVCSIH